MIITQAEKDEAIRKIERDLAEWRRVNGATQPGCSRCGDLGHLASPHGELAGKNCRAAARGVTLPAPEGSTP